MTGLYFSSTGNTKYCVEEFIHCFDSNNQAFSIEASGLDTILANEGIIVFGYPIQFSNIPKIVKDFILNNGKLFNNKKVFIIATMGLFSGDGTGCSARLIKKYNAKIIGGLHIKMPDCIGDVKLLKKTLEENQSLIREANKKIHVCAEKLKAEKPTKTGLNIFYHIAGLFGQRLWFYGKTLSYKEKPDINLEKCSNCGLCIKNCPMKNLEKIKNKIINKRKCTMCYRCVNNCPSQALTILRKQVYEQCSYKKYKIR
jgi:ferredoxin